MAKTVTYATEKWQNLDTGEVQQFAVQKKKIKGGDVNFKKVWINTLLTGLDDLTNKKMKVAFYVLQSASKTNNRFIGTYESIQKDIGVSYTVVAQSMKLLIDNDILKREQNGVYTINPKCLWYGDSKSRQFALFEFYDGNSQPQDLSIEMQRKQLEKSLQQIQRKLELLDQEEKKSLSANQADND